LADINVPIENIQKWLQNFTPFLSKMMRVLPIVVGTISSIMLILLFLEIITFQLFVLWFFVGLAITGTQLKKINALHENASKAEDTFEQYYKLISKIENTEFESALLQQQQQKVMTEKVKASQILKQFASILNAFDQRKNMLFGVLANGLLLFKSRRLVFCNCFF